MPWKGEKDPYKIWLSEIILQQTRVEQGLNYYNNFIHQYPTIIDLANAEDEKVFKLWEGLGYYSRCKNLLATARLIAKNYNGIFPSNYEDILNLKGVGPYTAAAIASFAFNLPYAVVDGNVQRVLSRYFAINTPIDSTDGKKIYQLLANELLDKQNPAIYNQAIMDFGATICKPQLPLCEHCVLNKDCQAYELKVVKDLPVKKNSLQRKNRFFHYFVLHYNNGIYIRKRVDKDIWQNLYEFLLIESPIDHDLTELKSHFWQSILEHEPVEVFSSPIMKQQLSHVNLLGQFPQIHLKNPISLSNSFEWVAYDQLKDRAWPKMIQQFLKEKSSLAQLF